MQHRQAPNHHTRITLSTCRCTASVSSYVPATCPRQILASATQMTPQGHPHAAPCDSSQSMTLSCASHHQKPVTRPCRRAQTSTANAVRASAAHAWCQRCLPVSMRLAVRAHALAASGCAWEPCSHAFAMRSIPWGIPSLADHSSV